jgi:hypothetical protein
MHTVTGTGGAGGGVVTHSCHSRCYMLYIYVYAPRFPITYDMGLGRLYRYT